MNQNVSKPARTMSEPNSWMMCSMPGLSWAKWTTQFRRASGNRPVLTSRVAAPAARKSVPNRAYVSFAKARVVLVMSVLRGAQGGGLRLTGTPGPPPRFARKVRRDEGPDENAVQQKTNIGIVDGGTT